LAGDGLQEAGAPSGLPIRSARRSPRIFVRLARRVINRAQVAPIDPALKSPGLASCASRLSIHFVAAGRRSKVLDTPGRLFPSRRMEICARKPAEPSFRRRAVVVPVDSQRRPLIHNICRKP
jgi:hypothetical protein